MKNTDIQHSQEFQDFAEQELKKIDDSLKTFEVILGILDDQSDEQELKRSTNLK